MKKFLSLAMLGCLAWMGCGPSFVMDTPGGFAHYDKETRFLKYISSDGVRVRTRAEKNEPYGEVAMWMGAADNHLKSKGYHKLETRALGTPENMKGTYSEYLYHFNAENHIYALAVFADREHLYIVEAGGAKKDFEKRRANILSAIGSLSVK